MYSPPRCRRSWMFLRSASLMEPHTLVVYAGYTGQIAHTGPTRTRRPTRGARTDAARPVKAERRIVDASAAALDLAGEEFADTRPVRNQAALAERTAQHHPCTSCLSANASSRRSVATPEQLRSPLRSTVEEPVCLGCACSAWRGGRFGDGERGRTHSTTTARQLAGIRQRDAPPGSSPRNVSGVCMECAGFD